MRTLISLGYRCDVAYQLRRHGQENKAHFFDWLAIPAEGLITILDCNFDVFHPDQLQLRRAIDNHSDCIVDRVTGTVFWHQFPMELGVIPVEYLVFYPQFKSKISFLEQRFRQTVSSRPVTLVRTYISEVDARRLERSFFARFPEADAQFLYLNDRDADFVTPAGHSRHLPETARSLGDSTIWQNLLMAEGLIEKPFRHSTAQILGHNPDDYNLSPDGRFAEAELQEAVAANPQSAFIKVELAQYYIGETRNDEALAQLDAACELDPGQGDWIIERIITRWKLGQYTASQAADEISTLKAPNDILQRLDFIELLLEAKQFASALGACNLLLSRFPQDAKICLIKAECCFELNLNREAEAAIDRVNQLQPMDWRIQIVRADLLMRLGKPFAARRSCLRAVELDDNIETRAARDKLLQRIDEEARSDTEIRRAG